MLERIELDRAGFACMLGGPDGTTLFMLAARLARYRERRRGDRAPDRPGARRRAPSPGVGWP